MYAIMMGSLTDDQVKRGPDYIDEANVQSMLKILVQYHVMSNPLALPLRG